MKEYMTIKKSLLKFVDDSGGDGDIIILLHGFLATSKYWDRVKNRLISLGYRVITIDLLGFGKAPKPKHSEYTYEAHIEHIFSAIDTLHLKKPFILAGHSMGALLAMRFSHLYKERVSSLVLLQPPLFRSTEEARHALRATGIHYRLLLDSRLRFVGWSIIKGLSVGMLTKHSKHSREGSLSAVIEKAEGISDLMRLTSPTLLMVGTQDRVEYIDNLARLRLQSHIKLKIDDVSHHAPLTSPDLVIERFLHFKRQTK